MKKLEFSIVTLINLDMELREKFGVKVKVRNFFYGEKPDPYFILEHEPSKEVKEFIWDYFDKEDGLVMFTDNGKKFIVYG